ncbi:MAG TPA: protein phosphatase 2C domain-containing protein [Actinoplanes sp.]|jgi:Protein phosphatase 2C|nr:protein phosphatase 2C domain-containing protein [Actinoplanes sp.]
MSSDRRPRWGAVAVGTPTEDFEPKPATSASYRPDTVADGWSTDDFTVRLASVRGYEHRHRGTPRQDDVAALHHPATGAVAFAVADGVSSAPYSHIGATAACRAALGRVVADLDAGSAVDWSKVVEHAAWQLVQQAAVVLGLDATDAARAEREMATTLVAGLVRPAPAGPDIALVRVGDSSAWVLRGGSFRPLFDADPAPGGGIAVSAVTALPRVPDISVRGGTLAPGEVLLVGTDGFGDPLGDGTGGVGAHFAVRLAAPRPPLAFAHDLDFSRETFDDDRTLLALWARQMS